MIHATWHPSVNHVREVMMLFLEGVRVLEVCQFMSGPYCCMLMADEGAEVIKIERPGEGDETRRQGPPFLAGEGIYYMSVNRNKKSVALNLKSPEAVEAFKKLAQESDVVVQNMRAGTMERLGLGYEQIKEVNPSIIYCSISGFGQNGPYKNRGGYDQIIQGMCGLMSVTGERGRDPVKVGLPITDISASMFSFGAINMALFNRERTGKGVHIDISMLDSGVSWMTFQGGRYLATGEIPVRMGSEHPLVAPYRTYRCGDGEYINIAAGNDRNYANLCRALGREDLIEDPRFVKNPDRVSNREILDQSLQEELLKKTRDVWVEIFEGAKVPCGPIYNMGDVFQDPQVIARDMLIEIQHPEIGSYKTFGKAIKLGDDEGRPEFSYPPPLGHHNDEILGGLGYTREQIHKMV